MKYVLDAEGNYQSQRFLTTGDQVTTSILPGFALDLDIVFAD
jgi:hypothetical protein